MGFGDEVIGSGLARGAVARGKRIAFGDGKKIIWSSQAHEVFKNNPNVARPGEENLPNIEWIHHYNGQRLYGFTSGGRWIFNPRFQCCPGEFFFSDEESLFGQGLHDIEVVIEPRVKRHGACSGSNKQWPVLRYQKLVHNLMELRYRCVQLVPPQSKPLLTGARALYTPSYRHAAMVLSKARLYIGPEGGLHHAAAAVGLPAVVLFGGFANPKVTGYSDHVNLTGGANSCGKIADCAHCQEAMHAIKVIDVMQEALALLKKREIA